MKNELDAKLLLKVFDLIYQKGEDFEDGKLYQGITAFSDIDGLHHLPQRKWCIATFWLSQHLSS